MIWIRCEIVPDEALQISALDRTFEHGLGLFETLRTWNGRPTLLDRHRERMIHSAGKLGLALDPRDFPDDEAVHQLRAAIGSAGIGDVRLRITLSGGLPSHAATPGQGTLWMTAGSLPPPVAGKGIRIVRTALADRNDPLARHKTLNYWRRRIELETAAEDGSDEVLYVESTALLCEGGRSNLFLVEDGHLVTPGTDGPLLDGVMRRVVLEWARNEGIPVVEASVAFGSIGSCSEAFLTNSVRGMLPVARLLHAELPAPGPITRRLWDRIRPWLESGGTTP
jgi:branched-subunit amino acid aminotransferase/4-amino-4-deoxychorismate lyase